ncbi:ribosomal protein L18e/L15P [Peziza echinospora]|nr:ribosomal protein L18e/L15P [Peziza echinospora]
MALRLLRQPLLSLGRRPQAFPPNADAIAPLLLKCGLTTAPPRHANILANLKDFDDSYQRVIRRGRGPSSGKGKTSGRGHKGQGQHGGVPAGFNGGQTKDIIVSGPYGEKNVHSVIMSPVNLDRLQEWIDAGRIDATKPITFKELCESRCLHGIKDGVKLLARGKTTFKHTINITVSRASAEAIAAVEAAGGTVTTRYFNKTGILSTAYPHHFPHNPRLADPVSRKDVEYYRNPAHRGYLSGTLKEGDNPESLFFKNADTADKARKQKRRQVGKKAKSDRLF